MITISGYLRPFSHRPNTICLIPGTQYVVQAFPALLRIKELSGAVVKELHLDAQGPLKLFTVMQDLERGCVTIFSESYRLHVLPTLDVVFQKNSGLSPLLVKERLSLGSHKKQDWEAILKRSDFKEIFPIWFRLGSLLDLPKYVVENRGVFGLLEGCREAVHSKRPETILPAFEKLFLSAFGHMFVPRLVDEDYQGILLLDTPMSDRSPLYLLSEGARLIRSLFIDADGKTLSILPNLPPEFFAGRMLHLTCGSLGTLDLEWSKKCIRRACFHATQDAEVTFRFQPRLSTFRVRQKLGEKGKYVKCGDSLEIKAGSLYLLDQFKK